MDKIKMTTPIVEMDGDEMTRILWQMIKDELLLPYIDLNTEYYDLGLVHRNETNDQVTIDSANATKKYGVAVKCATITPNQARMSEYDLKEMWKSPNGTIRAMLDGTVFRTPIIVKGIEPCVRNWEKPITLARHAYGDVYKNVEIIVPGEGIAKLVFTDKDGNTKEEVIHEFKGAGVIQGMHNTNKSIESFARACFKYALAEKKELWLGTKDTISKTYDRRFRDIFEAVSFSEIVRMYPIFHEMDITEFSDTMESRIASASFPSRLKALRESRGLSQSELASASGVNLRSIQLYEQGVNDIDKAQVITLYRLSRIIGCRVEDLMQNPRM